jgi:hypothetical protein
MVERIIMSDKIKGALLIINKIFWKETRGNTKIHF